MPPLPSKASRSGASAGWIRRDEQPVDCVRELQEGFFFNGS